MNETSTELKEPQSVHIRNTARKIIFRSTADTLAGAVIQAHEAGISLQGARLHNVPFKAENLKGIDFRGAHLTRVDFNRTDLAGANFAGSTQEDTNYNQVNLSGSDLSRSIFKKVDFHYSFLNDTDLRGIFMDHCQLSLTEFHRSDMRSSLLQKSEFEKCEFEGATLENSEITDTIISECSFLNADVSHVSILRSTLERIKGDGMKLSYAEIEKSSIACEIENVDFSAAALTDVRLGKGNVGEAYLPKGTTKDVPELKASPVIKPIIKEGPQPFATALLLPEMQN